jgi:hypothetical protein
VLSTRETLAMVVVMAILGAAAVGMTTTPARATTEPPAPRQLRSEAADAARAAEPGMPATPVLFFGGLMLAGLGALAVLIRRLDIRGARRATAALGSDAVEEELQQMIAEAVAWRRASTGA